METGLLETFREVARHGSISGAARGLAYSQSAVSRQIAALEAQVGARLLDREGRGVRLTEHGRVLLGHAESVLARIEIARRDLDALGRLDAGRLRIGAFPTAAAALIPRAMAAFAADHPNVVLSLAEGITRRQLARLESDDADVAVVSAFPGQSLDEARFDLLHLLDDAMLVALPLGHRFARRRRLRLADLDRERWIGAESRDDDRVLGPSRLAGGAEARTEFVVREWTAKLGLVAAGIGITLVPSLAAPGARGDVALVAIDPRDAPPRAVYAATLAGVTRAPATSAFIDALKASARALGYAGRSGFSPQ
jgi:DNA-binding transcriptional LysR family regulator